MTKTVIVPVSGGKDSQVVLALALLSGVKPVCVHQNTGYDHPATYAQLDAMGAFYGVKFAHTKSEQYGDMFGLLDSIKYFPNSAARGCTQRLKQEPFAKWLIANGYNPENCEIWFGMRADESSARDAKYGAIKPDDKFTLAEVSAYYGESWRGKAELGAIPCVLPIVTWSTDDVFSFLKTSGAPINALYGKGHHRVGCYPCLLARKAEWVAAAADKTGREHLRQLIEREERWAAEGNPRKYIKVHRTWDVRKFLTDGAADLADQDGQCGWCSI